MRFRLLSGFFTRSADVFAIVSAQNELTGASRAGSLLGLGGLAVGPWHQLVDVASEMAIGQLRE